MLTSDWLPWCPNLEVRLFVSKFVTMAEAWEACPYHMLDDLSEWHVGSVCKIAVETVIARYGMPKDFAIYIKDWLAAPRVNETMLCMMMVVTSSGPLLERHQYCERVYRAMGNPWETICH